MSIQSNLSDLLGEVPPASKLIAVSKTQPIEKIKQAYDAGQRRFGENKVQELVPKSEALPGDIEWHMIGHLQSNKVKYIAAFVHLIHAVDSPGLLQEINKQALKANRTIPCLLQVHIAQEETKFGFSAEEVLSLASSPALQQLKNVSIWGLMGMATFTDNSNQVRAEFRSLRMLFDKLKASALPAPFRLTELSMGMSGDYKIALEEGSTMIRVGSAIFGERAQQQQ
jgi:PLP dependent protein